ncbi:electron transfer flavoprotein subunit beta/FixA family protein [Legionella fairfieldensis]|uniref:electron transfer flavoprotein subunit beta/FixA family protein n=1 Tax=Legionella fairfieldensis TaxID=45064 RepID=UPI00048FCAF1|nr:electron transfer flavoprotein subunit beta/FixA family protein [Legionella fairfieldensis]
MKILVAVKRVIDPYVKIRVKEDASGVETRQVKMSINPFDEIALEEAIRLQERQIATEIVVVTIGPDASQEVLRHALALGANRAILVNTDKRFPSINIAQILQKIVIDEQPDLVLMGKQTIDGDNNQTPQMLAGLLDWPQATFVSKLDINGRSIEATREIDGGLQTLSMPLPAVVSTDLRLNEPRYSTLPNIMKAKTKPLQTIALETLGLTLNDHVEIIKVTSPPSRSGGVKVNSVEELIDKLQHEARAL